MPYSWRNSLSTTVDTFLQVLSKWLEHFVEEVAGAEADSPGGVGVDLVAFLDHLEELGHELDVARHAAAGVGNVHLDALAELVDELDGVADVGAAARRGV